MKAGKMLHAPPRFVSIFSTAFTPGCLITMGSKEIDSPRPRAPCRNFSNFFLKMTIPVITDHILVLVSMRKYILNHK